MALLEQNVYIDTTLMLNKLTQLLYDKRDFSKLIFREKRLIFREKKLIFLLTFDSSDSLSAVRPGVAISQSMFRVGIHLRKRHTQLLIGT